MSEKEIPFSKISEVPASAWKHLSTKRIFFAHQSVGFNIVEGIKDVMKEHPEIKLKIIESSDPSSLQEGTLEHTRVGKNTDPISKINGFMHFIEEGIGKRADFASLKFCYVDVRSDTDVDNLIESYSSSIAEIKKKYPDLTIVHFTVPLTKSRTTWKTIIKKMIGRSTWEYDDNIKRNRYNELLLKRYSGKEPVFDLAKIEATFPDGR